MIITSFPGLCSLTFALFLSLSLRWITNNNNLHHFWETLERESEVFLALCFYFFSFFSFLLPFHHNISYHSERVESNEVSWDGLHLFLAASAGFLLFLSFHIFLTLFRKQSREKMNASERDTCLVVRCERTDGWIWAGWAWHGMLCILEGRRYILGNKTDGV